MTRLLALFATLLMGLLILVPAAVAAETDAPQTGRVLISTNGDITVSTGDQVDALLVVEGTANVAGDVDTIVVVNGRAVLTGATAETVIAINSPVEVAVGSVVTGDIMAFQSEVTTAAGATIAGDVRDLAPSVAGVGLFVGTAMLVLYLGFALAAIAAGLLLAGLAARQVRDAETLMRTAPVPVIAAGFIGLVVPVLLLVVLSATVIGIPLAFGLVFGLWPLVAFLGYLVAGIAIGDWIVGRMSPNVVRERPYLAALVGIVLLEVVGLVPFVAAIASFYGFGAVLLLAWRTLTAGSAGPASTTPRQAPAPMAG